MLAMQAMNGGISKFNHIEFDGSSLGGFYRSN